MLTTTPRELREACGLTRPTAAAWLNITTRTLRRWESTGRAPVWALDKLHVRAYGLPLDAEPWRGWRLWRGALVSPEGLEYTPGTLRAWQFKQQELETLRRQFRRWCEPGRQMELWPGSELRARLSRG